MAYYETIFESEEYLLIKYNECTDYEHCHQIASPYKEGETFCKNCQRHSLKEVEELFDVKCSERDCDNFADNGDGLCSSCMYDALADYVP